MTPEQVLSHTPIVLTQAQREFYFEQGYLVLEDVTPQHWLDRLRAVTAELVEKSRAVLKSNKEFDLEPNHMPQDPRIRRLIAPVDRSAEHTSELQSLMRISYAVFCLKKKT